MTGKSSSYLHNTSCSNSMARVTISDHNQSKLIAAIFIFAVLLAPKFATFQSIDKITCKQYFVASNNLEDIKWFETFCNGNSYMIKWYWREPFDIWKHQYFFQLSQNMKLPGWAVFQILCPILLSHISSQYCQLYFTAVRALVWNNGTLLCKIDFNRNLSF